MRRLAALTLLLVACGSRTGLWVDDDLLVDGRIDGSADAADPWWRDASVDAPPPLDASPRDASRIDCEDAGDTLVYLISADYALLSFDPMTLEFRSIGRIACPAAASATPFSMAVDRAGVAYVLFQDSDGGSDDGRIFRVSTATAACIGTPFTPNQLSFRRFGMGFATDEAGPTEALFVADSDQDGVGQGLGRVDVTSFGLTRVGAFSPTIRNAELTGTGDGRLFGFYSKAQQERQAYIGEIDRQTAEIVGEARLEGVRLGSAWAFAFWGGAFYMFTAESGSGSAVTRYHPSEGSPGVIAQLSERIVGAGVSTCAPAQ